MGKILSIAKWFRYSMEINTLETIIQPTLSVEAVDVLRREEMGLEVPRHAQRKWTVMNVPEQNLDLTVTETQSRRGRA